MGNPNVLWWRWDRFASSVVNATALNIPLKVPGLATPPSPFLGGRQVLSGNVDGGDFIEIHELHMIEVGAGFPNNVPPFIDVDFEINDVAYYRKNWSSRNTPPFVVDLNVVGSNTGGGSAPLILSGGETIRITMTDGARPSGANRYLIETDLWGLKL